MKLNHECVRDLLLLIENTETLNFFQLSQIYKGDFSEKYTFETAYYTATLLADGGFLDIKCMTSVGMRDIAIYKITWNGHQFLDNVRDDRVWSESTSVALEKVTSVSLNILSTLASKIIANQLGL